MTLPVVAGAGAVAEVGISTIVKSALAKGIIEKFVQPIYQKGVEIGMEEMRDALKDFKDKNEQIKEERIYEWYHNYIVYDILQYSGGYMVECISKYLLHLVECGERREKVVEILKYLANKKPKMYEYVGDDISDLMDYKPLFLAPKPVESLDDFINQYKLFCIKHTLDRGMLSKKYKTDSLQVMFILNNVCGVNSSEERINLYREYLIEGNEEGVLSKIKI